MKKIFTIKRLTFDLDAAKQGLEKLSRKFSAEFGKLYRDKGFDCYQGGGIRQTLGDGIGKENEYSG